MSILPASGIGDESTGFYPVTIDQSLRFDGSSSYLTKTPSSDGNRRKWTFSAWIKFSQTDDLPSIFGKTRTGNNREGFAIGSSQKLQYQLRVSTVTKALVESEIVLRDTSSWYHIMMIWDSDNATASNRVIFYVNGQNAGLEISTTPVQYTDSFINSTNQNYIGWTTGGSNYLHGYMAEVNFVDGQALTPSSFGETKNGVWIPKAYTGSYGTNGFRLTFADSSSLGDDTSGNGNDYTSSGLASTDIVIDSPTNNFSTLNSIGNDNQATFSEGNLKISFPQDINAQPRCQGTFAVSSGKWYWEVNVISITTATTPMIGIKDLSVSGHESHIFSGSSVYAYYANSGNKYNSGNLGSYGASYTAGDIIGVALDLDAGTLTFYKNNVSQGTAFSSLSGEYTPHFGTGYYAYTAVVNFGQDGTFAGNETAQGNTDDNGIGDFYYSPPSGHLALCSSNLPDTTISPNKGTQADDHFNTVLYTGNNGSQSITGVGFQPDWLWTKSRSASGSHSVFDSARGRAKSLFPNLTNAEATSDSDKDLVSFDSDGFTLGAVQQTGVNANSTTMVAWNWRAGGEPTADNSAGAGNTPTSGSVKIDGSNKSDALAGTIAATRLTANTTSGFSVITYTGNNGSSGTIAHGLNSAPEWVLIFGRNVSNSQMLGVTPMGFTKYASFQTTGGYFVADSTIWNDTAPTSTVFTVGSAANVNDAYNYVAYCFHSVEGYSKIGTYLGNGNTSSDGPYVYLGFRPAWLFVKRTNNTGGAIIWDNKRSTSNPTDDYLVSQLQDDEELNNSTQRVDFLSNGFKVRNGATSNSINGSGSTYLYLAFAEQPFKFSNAR